MVTLFPDAVRLSRDRPLSGSLLRLREKQRLAAWDSPNKIHSLEETEEDAEDEHQCLFPPILDREFPQRLPQTPVELELGVIGLMVDKSQSVFAEPSDTPKLLALAAQWRRNFRTRKLTRPASAKGRLAGYDVILSSVTDH